ncbi:MAG: beta-lactamase family protein [Saprospiraceae bacterium]|nr:beta-lactamase family protein [Saprospiraceae bacterium]
MTKYLLLLITVLYSFLPALAQEDLDQRLIQKTQNLIEEKLETDKIVGVSAAIILNDSIIWEKGFGYADLESQVAMDENTVVHIGSVTKPVTALCAMQLQQRGLLNINEPIATYLPQFDPHNQFGDNSEVTVKHLIMHAAGLQGDIFKNSDLASGKYTDVVGFINQTHILYPPGRLEYYSNVGYNILGHIIKEVSGVDYAQYVHEHIFKPLGMTQSGFYMDSLANSTKIYDRNGQQVIDYPLRDIASGGIYCSVHDFALLAQGIINSYHGQSPALVDSTTMRHIFSLQNEAVDYVIGKNKRGLGWYLFEDEDGLAANHTGSAGYAFAHLMVFPKDKAAIMLLTNSPNGRALAENAGYKLLEDFGLEIADVFLPQLIEDKKQLNEESVFVSKEILKTYAGNYAEPISYTRVIVENDTLQIIRGDEQFSLIPSSPTSFIPLDSNGDEIKNTRYHFEKIGSFPCLVVKDDQAERVLGYKFAPVNSKKWQEKVGRYEHFGYQLKAGDMKFEGIELKITDDNVLLAVIYASGNIQYPMPIDLISEQYGKTAGLLSGYGWTLTFSESAKYYLIDFAGITFRKEK